MFEAVKGIYGEDSGLFNKSHPVYREWNVNSSQLTRNSESFSEKDFVRWSFCVCACVFVLFLSACVH